MPWEWRSKAEQRWRSVLLFLVCVGLGFIVAHFVVKYW